MSQTYWLITIVFGYASVFSAVAWIFQYFNKKGGLKRKVLQNAALVSLALVTPIGIYGEFSIVTTSVLITPEVVHVTPQGINSQFPITAQNTTDDQIDDIAVLLKISPLLSHENIRYLAGRHKRITSFNSMKVDEENINFNWSEHDVTYSIVYLGSLAPHETVVFEAIVTFGANKSTLNVNLKRVNWNDYRPGVCAKIKNFPEFSYKGNEFRFPQNACDP